MTYPKDPDRARVAAQRWCVEAVRPKPHQGPSHPTIATVRPTRPREGSEPDTIAKRLIET